MTGGRYPPWDSAPVINMPLRIDAKIIALLRQIHQIISGTLHLAFSHHLPNSCLLSPVCEEDHPSQLPSDILSPSCFCLRFLVQSPKPQLQHCFTATLRLLLQDQQGTHHPNPATYSIHSRRWYDEAVRLEFGLGCPQSSDENLGADL